MNEFEKYAHLHCGISSLRLHDYKAIHSAYINPMIFPERISYSALSIDDSNRSDLICLPRILFRI